MAKVTAVVKLIEKAERHYNYQEDTVSLKFGAAYTDKDGNRVNQEWASATPQFNMDMVVKSAIGELFSFDKEYLLTFEEK